MWADTGLSIVREQDLICDLICVYSPTRSSTTAGPALLHIYIYRLPTSLPFLLCQTPRGAWFSEQGSGRLTPPRSLSWEACQAEADTLRHLESASIRCQTCLNCLLISSAAPFADAVISDVSFSFLKHHLDFKRVLFCSCGVIWVHI